MMSPDLRFAITRAEGVPFAAAPTLVLGLEVSAPPGTGPLGGAFLRCQVQIDATRRHYRTEERERLADLFGAGPLWDRGLRTLHWTQLTILVPAFEHATEVEVELPLSHDLTAVLSRYMGALEGGAVPLRLLLSGTVFHQGSAGVQLSPISWSREASFDLPVATWDELLSRYFPDAEFVPLRRGLVERLRLLQARSQLSSLDELLEGLMVASQRKSDPS
jgi:hypothetical protein